MSSTDWGTGIGSLAGAGLGFAIGGPMGAGLGMSGGGLLGGLIGGSLEEEQQAPPPVSVDPALYTTPGYNAYLGSIDAQQGYYGRRQAPTMDWSMANQDRGLALEARGIQGEAAQSYRDVLAGKAPSLAQLQLQQGLTTANAMAAQQAASTRGGGGNALLAAQNAQRVSAANALATSAQAGQLRAQELAAARQGLLAAGSQIRGQDLDMRGQSQGQTQMTAQNELAQRQLNDAMARQLEQGRLAALGGQQAAQSQYASDSLAAAQGNRQAALASQQAAQAQRNRNQDYQRQLVGGALQQGGSLAAMGMPQPQGSNQGTPQPQGNQGTPTASEWDSAWQQSGGRKWW